MNGNESSQQLKSLGKYAIERKLGQGGMGAVYLAKNLGLKKTVALKVLPRDKARNPVLVRRFQAEAQAAGQLEHPNIVSVYDSGEADGYLYIAMEYVDGIDMFEYLKRAKVVPVNRSIEIIKQVASALQHAYEQNIVHRDIKPSNLLLRRDGTVKLTDLGLARSIDDTLETNITRAGTTVGTVDYMSPEQARNSKSADIRSDIYSLGCTWYQMLTGSAPFPDGSMTNKLHAHATKELPDPRELNEDVPEGIYAILRRMTAKKPEDRYQTPGELLEDLTRSKLTNAAFSDEIFNDSDDEIATADEDDDEVYEEEEDFDDPAPARKAARGAPRDLDVSRSDLKRGKAKRRASDEDDDDDVEEMSSDSARTKRRPVSEEKTPNKKTKSIKSTAKSTSDEIFDDDDDSDERTLRGKKAGQKSDAEKSGKAKAKSSTEVPNSRPGMKPMPPKRRPLNEDAERPVGLSFETIKPFVIIGALLIGIGSLGIMVSRWGGQFGADPVVVTPKPEHPAPQAPPAAVQQQQPATVDPPVASTDKPQPEFDISKAPLPAWSTAPATDPKDLPTFLVRLGATAEGTYSTIADAIKEMNRAGDKKGGVIRLAGNGPFVLSQAETAAVNKLIVMPANPDDRPLVMLSSAEANGAVGLAVANGELDLRNIDFVVNRSADTSAFTCIDVKDGQLALRSCSFTATGSEGVPVTAIGFQSSQDAAGMAPLEPRLLVDRVTVRGDGLTGIKLNRTTAEVVVQDSLLATGIAPCLDLSGTLNPGIPDMVQSKPRRIVRFVRSTLSGRKQILQFASDSTSKPPATELLFLDSICSTEGAGTTATLVGASKWSGATKPRLANLNWTSLRSLYLGFDKLVDLGTSYNVQAPDEWFRVWNRKLDPVQFQKIFWQESVASNLSLIGLDQFDTEKLHYKEVKTEKGGAPGCDVRRLQIPGVISESRLIAISNQPKAPTISSTSPVSASRKVDLAKGEDLGAVLNKADWASGTVFEVSGFGSRTMSPARISNKSLRITFVQAEGAPLRLQARAADAKVRAESPGLFTIENGTLEIQSVVMETLQSNKIGACPWLISAKDSSVILKGCQLNGPMNSEVEQHQGLIHWVSRGGDTAAAIPGLSLADCVLFTTSDAIKAEWNYGNIFVTNSVIAARGNGLHLNMISSVSSQSPTVKLEHVSLSAAKAAIRLEQSDAPTTTPPVRIFADFCAVLPPLEFKDGEAKNSSFIEIVGKPLDRSRLEWWGHSNGVAKEVQAWLRQPGVEPIRTPAGWNSIWGDAGDDRFLTSNDGVQLENNFPTKLANIKLESFSLEPTSPGARWADGVPLGADISSVKAAIASKAISKDPKSSGPGAKTANQNKPTPPRPPGKTQTGF